MSESHSAAQPRGRILLVEDHSDTAIVMSRLLEKLGYQTQVADSVAVARSMAAQDGAFDLLVCDIRLPDGSGLELMRELRGKSQVRGIALSGMAGDDDRDKSRAAGFEHHLSKPVDLATLRKAVEEMMK